jgi:TonB family protein
VRVASGIFGLYIAFLLFKLLLLLRAWRRTQSIVRGSLDSPLPDHLEAIVDRCRHLIGVKQVRILHSSNVPVPITLGVVHPIIVLPEDLLKENDRNLLSSAIGHELVHVARRDYLWNLVFETIYLPLSFHPAMALVRRRIRQTRELCCDEIVAMKLLNAETYAHSLMRLIGSAPLSPRLISDTAIGLNQSDILEVRIMSLLNSKNRKSRSPRTVLIAAALILGAPCLAGAKLALKLDVYAQEPAQTAAQEKEAKQQIEKSLQGLREQARDLNDKLKGANETQRKEIEARLAEVQKNLEEHERAAVEFRYQREDLDKMRTEIELYAKSSTVNEAELKKMREYLTKIETEYPKDDTRVREVKETLAMLESAGQNRKARVTFRVEPEYPPDARAKQITGTVVLGVTVGHDGSLQNVQVKKSLFPSLDESAIAAVHKWHFEAAMKDGQPVSFYMVVEFYFSPDGSGADAYREKEEREAGDKEKEIRVRVNENEAKRSAERDFEEKRNTILAGMAQISMDRAIQIATSASPGKVLECSLMGERWSNEGELAKPSLVLYHVVILSNDSSPVRTHVLVNAIDGSVFRVSKEEKREEDESAGWTTERGTTGYATRRRAIEGGTLNGKAASLPNPEYPAIARAAKVSGTVTVAVVVDEEGNVVEAKAVSGHPLLQASAVNAARQAKFTRTFVNGEPTQINGYLIYNFVAP